MTSDNQLATALVEFAQVLVDQASAEAVLEALGDHCKGLLPVDGVGVLLSEEGDLTVATTNSELGDAAEGLEVELGQGPCVDVVRTGRPIAAPDLAACADRWPEFVTRAVDAGVGSVHGLPLIGRGEILGSLNIVNHEPLELSPDQLAVAQVLGDVAVSYILAVRLHEASSQLATQLQHALDSRVVIEQAKGVLAERHGTGMAEAFDRLRRHARSNNDTVRSAARAVVEGRLHP